MSAIGQSWNKLLELGSLWAVGLLPHFFTHYVKFGFISRVPASRIPFRCIDEGSLLWVFFVRNNLSGRRHVHFCVETWAMTSCTMSVLLKMLFELMLSLLSFGGFIWYCASTRRAHQKQHCQSVLSDYFHLVHSLHRFLC